jgi:hypothetical protein
MRVKGSPWFCSGTGASRWERADREAAIHQAGEHNGEKAISHDAVLPDERGRRLFRKVKEGTSAHGASVLHRPSRSAHRRRPGHRVGPLNIPRRRPRESSRDDVEVPRLRITEGTCCGRCAKEASVAGASGPGNDRHPAVGVAVVGSMTEAVRAGFSGTRRGTETFPAWLQCRLECLKHGEQYPAENDWLLGSPGPIWRRRADHADPDLDP